MAALTVSSALAGAGWAGAFTDRDPASPTTVSPGYPVPPGWVARPSAPGTGQVCFDGLCYRVDGGGNPYGPPLAPTGA